MGGRVAPASGGNGEAKGGTMTLYTMPILAHNSVIHCSFPTRS